MLIRRGVFCCGECYGIGSVDIDVDFGVFVVY